MSQKYTLNANGPERDNVLANMHALVDRLPAKKSWRIEIKEARKERTDDQNRALFGCAYPAIKAVTGDDIDDLHESFCGKFFGWVDREVMGEVKRRPFRTTTTDEQGERDVLPTTVFAEFYNTVQRIAAEVGIDVPDPDPFWREIRQAS